LVLNQNDIVLPGKSGLDLVIKRSYNSKAFKADPSWKSSHEKQWGGWAGYGWQFNIGGKLIVINRSGYNNSAANVAVLSLDGGSYSFEDVDKDGIYENKAKGAFDYLKKDNDSYTYFSDSGKRYVFKTLYYKNYKILDSYRNSSEDVEWTISGLFLDNILDRYGNTVTINYELFASANIESSSSDSGHTECEEYTVSHCSWYLFGTCMSNWIEYKTSCSWVKDFKIDEGDHWYPYRPISIEDNWGRKLYIEYANNNVSNTSQITKIWYEDSSLQKLEYEYDYNSSGQLVQVKQPLNISIQYSYTLHNQTLSGKYNDEGHLLTEVELPSGLKSTYTYNWYDPRADSNNSGFNISNSASKIIGDTKSRQIAIG